MSSSSGQPWIFFDCDSTLSAIEGVDELARLRPREIYEEIVNLTNLAMNGEIALDEVFGRRLRMIGPTRSECEQIGQQYIDEMEPTAVETIDKVRELGWTPAIISGGYVPVIRPLADHLGIEVIEAVDLEFDEKGNYVGFIDHPNARNGGKPEVIRRLKFEHPISRIVMVGDGISDLETKSEVEKFIGFGRYARREKVEADADAFIMELRDVLPFLSE